MYSWVVAIEAWPEQLLHDPDVGAVVEHVGGAAVAQHVGGETVAEADPVAVAAHDPPRALAGQPPAAAVEEHRLGVAAPGPPGRRHGPRPPGASQAGRASRAKRPTGTTRSLAPLPNARTTPSSSARSPRDRPTELRDAHAGAVERPPAGPGPAGPRGRRRRRRRAAGSPRPRSAPWAGPGAPADAPTSPVGSLAGVAFIEQEAVQGPNRHQGPGHRWPGARPPARKAAT